MKSNKNDPSGEKKKSHQSPQQELLEKSRHNPNLGRKPPGKAHKPKVPDAEQEIKPVTTVVKEKKKTTHKTLDTSGQDIDI